MKRALIRKTFEVPEELWKLVADFRFDRRIETERETLCTLIEAGLKAEAKPKPTRAKGKI